MTHRRGAVALAILLAAAAGLSLLHVLAALPELVIRAQSRSLEVLAELPELSAAHLAALPEAHYFLGEPSVVVPVERSGDWLRVLTPARQRLHSDPAGTDPGSTDSPGLLAPAQTSARLRADSLSLPTILTNLIIVSVSAQTLRIIRVDSRTWLVGVGAPGTPTPIGVTGYLEARYRDAAQGQAEYPVQLTSLQSTAADEPFGGNDGGLMGIHFPASASRAVSHGCIRVPLEVITAVNALPLGTLITIEE